MRKITLANEVEENAGEKVEEEGEEWWRGNYPQEWGIISLALP